MESIQNLLGEAFYIKGRVITGNRIGRTISFPTANVKYPTNIIKPPRGVYIARVSYDDCEFNAMANLGKRPTIAGAHGLLLEAHILDFKDNLYDKDVKISFIKKIRDERKFDSLPDLKSQLVKDEKVTREFFSNY